MHPVSLTVPARLSLRDASAPHPATNIRKNMAVPRYGQRPLCPDLRVIWKGDSMAVPRPRAGGRSNGRTQDREHPRDPPHSTRRATCGVASSGPNAHVTRQGMTQGACRSSQGTPLTRTHPAGFAPVRLSHHGWESVTAGQASASQALTTVCLSFLTREAHARRSHTTPGG